MQVRCSFENFKNNKNPPRLFYDCPNYGSKNESCDFFDWYDNAKYEQDKEELQRLTGENVVLNSENASLRCKLQEMEIKYEALQQNIRDTYGNAISWKVAIILMLVAAYIAKLM
ncbi:hypothetical protein CASFOL_026170 [Castilleja foliolosa]|uniref:Zinc finger GRF-type domain-containing protein n=1 Tax=Castilleja foliolosa TaxID=1961234 RepID=A0ABD3CIW9_9LAMI